MELSRGNVKGEMAGSRVVLMDLGDVLRHTYWCLEPEGFITRAEDMIQLLFIACLDGFAPGDYSANVSPL